MNSELFVIPLWADLLAVGIGALQGALFSAQFRDRRLDWLGVAIVGIATGFGGGLLRDMLLSDLPALAAWQASILSRPAHVKAEQDQKAEIARHSPADMRYDAVPKEPVK